MITIEGVKNTAKWKAVRGHWDGRKKKRLKKRVWNCDQSRRKGEVDHRQHTCSTVESMRGHGCGNRN